MHPEAAQNLDPWSFLLPTRSCPPELKSRFTAPGGETVTVRRRAIRREPDEASTYITTWLTPEVCLGSVNRDTFWTQRQVVKAYWNGADGVPVMLRLRFLHDGVDFASALVNTAQRENRVLAGVSLLTNQGDYHPSLDRPKDGIFLARDFRLRWELIGGEVTVSQLGDGSFELLSGSTRAVVHSLPGQFGEYSVRWGTGQEEGKAFVDGVCYEGEERPFELAELGKVVVVCGLELLGQTAERSASVPEVDVNGDDEFKARWGEDMRVAVPLCAHKCP